MERQESRKKGVRFAQLYELIQGLWQIVSQILKMARALDYHKDLHKSKGVYSINDFIEPNSSLLRQAADFENIFAHQWLQQIMISQQNISEPFCLSQASCINYIDGYAEESFSFLSFGERYSFPQEFALLAPESISLNFLEVGLQSKPVEPLPSRIFGDEECAESRRTDNTIFKTSLSEYRKSIIDESKEDPRLNWIRDEIKLIYKAKNLSVFPKLIVLSREIQISAQIEARWQRRSDNLLRKKKELMGKGKYCRKRYEQLQRSVEVMTATMRQLLLQNMLQVYWGKYKQASRFGKSKEQVINYRNNLINLLRSKASHECISAQ